jgi:hypothetical protein
VLDVHRFVLRAVRFATCAIFAGDSSIEEIDTLLVAP